MSRYELLLLHSHKIDDEICQSIGATNIKTKAFHAKC